MRRGQPLGVSHEATRVTIPDITSDETRDAIHDVGDKAGSGPAASRTAWRLIQAPARLARHLRHHPALHAEQAPTDVNGANSGGHDVSAATLESRTAHAAF